MTATGCFLLIYEDPHVYFLVYTHKVVLYTWYSKGIFFFFSQRTFVLETQFAFRFIGIIKNNKLLLNSVDSKSDLSLWVNMRPAAAIYRKTTRFLILVSVA